jgi:hypothetical protein
MGGLHLVVAVAILCGPPRAAASETATLFRVFLTDGTAVVSYGEYARVGDRVIFSMPIGALGGEPQLHLVNLPASAVDWASTTRYAESARFVHYAASRAETDYAALTAEVASALNTIALTPEAPKRLDLALQARRRLAEWPQAHYGYRASDVRDILGFLDEAISGLRAAAGETSFGLDLVATVEPPPAVPSPPDPTPAEAIAHALTVAGLADVPADRISLLNAAVAAIDDKRNPLPDDWARRTRASALRTLAGELSTERAYSRLSATMLSAASTAAGRADVRVVETVLANVLRRDEQLGRKRPDQINALIASVQARLDAARRLRLARDQWTARSDVYRAYRGAVDVVLDQLSSAQGSLDDIKRLAGPRAAVLARLTARLASGAATLTRIAPPDELRPAHALFASALNLAANAVQARREAVESGSLQRAWDASSAAAGSIMLFARARADMEAVLAFPRLR